MSRLGLMYDPNALPFVHIDGFKSWVCHLSDSMKIHEEKWFKSVETYDMEWFGHSWTSLDNERFKYLSLA